MTNGAKPDRADVCIIGAGASGAAAAKVLTERGMRVVMLERGPWRTRETFGGDELANINRYNLWPDPLLNPRTVRDEVDGEFRTELFCPVPQMVGGGTVHWQGWLPRFTEERLPAAQRRRRRAGNDAGRLADHLRRARAVLHPGRVGVRCLGPGRREPLRVLAQQGLSLPAAAAVALCAEVPPGLRGARLELVPHSAGRAVPAFQRPAGDGHQRLRPAARRPDRHPVQRAQRVRARCAGDRSARPAARTPTSREITVDERGRAKGAVYEDEDGTTYEQEADVVILACGAVETARLLLLSTSSALPERARQRQRPGRSQRHLPRVQRRCRAPSRTRSTPGPAAATSAPARFEFNEHDDSRGFAGGGHIACAGVGIPLPINWSLPDRPAWGAEAKQVDRELLQPQHGRVPWSCTTCRSTTTESSSTTRSPTPGVCRSRAITLKPHENDLAMGRFLIDRNAEILEAAGATTVQKVYIDRITGNCSHQHGTTRMGNDPETSVLDRWCRATRSTTSSSSTAARSRPAPAQPDPDDHGERLAGRRAHRQRTPHEGAVDLGHRGAPRLRQRCRAANPPAMPPHFTSESASEAALEI